ncbi:hypothetical protein AVEN_1266-1, partial [Araneus ventricosus]
MLSSGDADCYKEERQEDAKL